ncbi:SBBP repeat-containing protein [Paludibaculum fermentans]|uniref:SBBP repeat-containing protein n=1 Tax=Paludibaculum fermentans TaxID=1473598 RepID=A0A7S7SIG4_PALFE|nr:SBBP repeat-containing protein [Paludibaculum fermentans]QOY86049.1 SBBP repeat-containing protein [Paludibaculum fermentans]
MKTSSVLGAAWLAATMAAGMLPGQQEAQFHYFLGKDPAQWRRGETLRLRNRDRIRAASLSYSTFLGGGSNEHASAVVTDDQGNIYMTGYTMSADFPVTEDAYQGSLGYSGYSTDAFVAKFDANGRLVYCTFLGGASDDKANAIAVDRYGNAYITGSTISRDFPTTEGAIVTTLGTAAGAAAGVFVTKLNAAGNSILYSTLLARGVASDSGNAIAVDAAGYALVAGKTSAVQLRVTTGAMAALGTGSGFLVKLNPAGSRFVFVTSMSRLTDQVNALTTDRDGNVYVTGSTNDLEPRDGGAQRSNAGRTLFLTSDAGAHWALPGPGLEDMRVASVTFDPRNAAVVYAAGTRGLFRSTDGGGSWSLFYSGENIAKVVLDPSDSSHMVVFAFTSVVFRYTQLSSRDGGLSWTSQVTNFGDMVCDPADARRCSAGGSAGFYFSADGGDTWGMTTIVGENNFSAPVIDRGNPGTLYSTNNHGVWRSQNFGVTWSSVNRAVPIAGLVVHPDGNGVLYGAYASFLLKSVDGGVNWTQIGYALSSRLFFDPVDRRTLYQAGSQGLLRSTDDGRSFEAVASQPLNSNVFGLEFAPNQPGVWFALSGAATDAFLTKVSADGSTQLFSTYFGGASADTANRIALDGSGNIYIAGSTNSSDLNGAVNAYGGGRGDAFVAKFSADGSRLLYSRLVGGQDFESGLGLAVDAAGRAVLTGATYSADFPRTVDALPGAASGLYSIGYYLQLDPDGAVVSASYLGGPNEDSATAAAISTSGKVCIVGDTNSPEMATTPGAAQPVRNGFADTFLMILDLVR